MISLYYLLRNFGQVSGWRLLRHYACYILNNVEENLQLIILMDGVCVLTQFLLEKHKKDVLGKLKLL